MNLPIRMKLRLLGIDAENSVATEQYCFSFNFAHMFSRTSADSPNNQPSSRFELLLCLVVWKNSGKKNLKPQSFRLSSYVKFRFSFVLCFKTSRFEIGRCCMMIILLLNIFERNCVNKLFFKRTFFICKYSNL